MAKKPIINDLLKKREPIKTSKFEYTPTKGVGKGNVSDSFYNPYLNQKIEKFVCS